MSFKLIHKKALKQFSWISKVANRLDNLAIGIINKSPLFIGLSTLILHHPFKSGANVYNIVITLKKDICHDDIVFVDNFRPILCFTGFRKFDFYHAIE
ncbi:hypothetical protein O9A_00917 [Bartonella koehlerae C-29]|uniref:Uncharacterized protein n=1 Tax=Bartonella koehlerae C-29 TaxID=1134510 RepID=A0A067WGL4_9HYPH|nr:hypothetical protein O9A_00917 [Bartonella koehlerae C-29]